MYFVDLKIQILLESLLLVSPLSVSSVPFLLFSSSEAPAGPLPSTQIISTVTFASLFMQVCFARLGQTQVFRGLLLCTEGPR